MTDRAKFLENEIDALIPLIDVSLEIIKNNVDELKMIRQEEKAKSLPERNEQLFDDMMDMLKIEKEA